MSDNRLNELRQRWEADPKSRVFLQLAEEHRRLGQAQEAIDVLEKGLERSPNHLSAHVALGRCHLELEDHEKAAEILGRVLDRDPTQLVANKLLVEAHLGLGNLRRAEAQLERYSQLNSGDPVIEEMGERLAKARKEAAAAPLKAPSRESSPLLADVDELVSPELESPDLESPDPFPSLVAKSSPPPASGPFAPTARTVTVPQEDPFPELFAAPTDDRQHLQSLGDEGLFPVDLPPAPEKQASSEDDLFALDKPAPAEALAEEEDLFGLSARAPAPKPVPAPKVPASLPELQHHARVEKNFDRLDLEIHSPEPAPETPAPVQASVHARVRTNFDRLEARIHHQPPSPPVEVPPFEEPPIAEVATVTLGNLYRQQGHEEKAQEVFRAVLDQDPTHAEAREALGETVTPETAIPETVTPETAIPETVTPEDVVPEDVVPDAVEPDSVEPGVAEPVGGDGAVLTAAHLLAGADPSLGLLDRKALLLENYLRRVRREA